ncbi:MAG: CBS domain-containing protein [Anaerolineales bacterium]|jgi:acetoin utilization protein AcuB
MTHPVITVEPDTPVQEALNMMRRENVRRMPVTDSAGHLVGIVAERDLLHASPSDATSLSVWELNYLLSKIVVKEVMTKDVVTITEDTLLETAARIMADRKIGGIPVMRDSKVVGIMTETDLFKIFLEILGARKAGVRLTVMVPNKPGELAQITKAIFDLGGNIIAMGTFLGEDTESTELTIKVEDVDAEALRGAIEPMVSRVIDVRDTLSA